jgi:signal transduction histidine kinase
MQDFDLGELIRESAAPFEEPAGEKGLSLNADTTETVVKANRESIGQLIGILLDNAVKYTPKGGEISLTAFREGNSVILRQQNTVSPDDIEEDPERLFDRFYRRDEARTQKKGGSGIGLSAARAIASANGAQISAAYREQNIVFTVKLMA